MRGERKCLLFSFIIIIIINMIKGHKQCSDCKAIKPVEEFPPGRGQCRACKKAQNAKYHKENPEKKKAYNAKYKKENPEKIKAYNAKYNKENPEKIEARHAKYKKENRETIKAREAKYRKENPEKTKATAVKYRKVNPEKIKAYQAKHRERNYETIKARHAKHREELFPVYVKSRLSSQFGLPANDIPQELIELKTEALTAIRLSRKIKEVLNECS